jgi:hypothetical protein
LDQAREYRSTGRCTDAGAGNLPGSPKSKAQDIGVRGLVRKEMKVRLVVASEWVLDMKKVRAGFRTVWRADQKNDLSIMSREALGGKMRSQCRQLY